MADNSANIALTVNGDTSQLRSDLKKGQMALDSFEDRAKKVAGNLVKMGAAAAAAGVALAAATYAKQSQVIDALAKTADALNITTEKLQALQHMAGLSGVEADEMNKAIQRMQKGLGEAARKGGAAADALDDIGVSIKDVVSMDADEQMRVLATALKTVETQAEKASIASDLFGRNGLRMLKVLNQLDKEGLEPTIKSLDDMGASISRIDAQAVEDANDSMAKAQEAVQGLANELTISLAPIVQEVADAFTNWVKESGGLRAKLEELRPAFNAVVNVLKVMASIYAGQLAGAMAGYLINIAKTVAANAVMVKSMGFAAVAARGLRMALALLGGPIGIIAAVVTSLVLFKSSSKETVIAADDLSESVDILTQSMDDLSQTGAKVALIDIEKPLRQAAKAAESAQVDVDRQIEKFKNLNASYLEEMNKFQVYMKAGATDTAIGYGLQAEAIKAKMPEYQEALDRANLILEEAIKTEQALLDRKAALQGIAAGSAPQIDGGQSDTQRLMEKKQQDHELMIAQQQQHNQEMVDAVDVEMLEQKYSGYFERRQQAQQENNEKLLADTIAYNEAQVLADEMQLQQRRANIAGVQSLLGQMSSMMSSESKVLFNIGKAAAIANATIDGIASAISAFRVGSSIGGPVLGASFAAASGVATGVMIKQLASQTQGGGASKVSTPSVSAPTAQGANAGQTMTVQGLDSNSFYSGEMVTGLVDKLLDYQRDGGRVILG